MKRRAFLGAAIPTLGMPFLPGGAWARAIASDGALSATLANRIQGQVFRPGSAEYDRKRRGSAADVDLYPAMIVRAVSAAGVSAAVTFAREKGMPLAVRGGGHSYAGYNSCAGGIVIDLSALTVLEPAADGRTMRIGGGALSGHVEQATARIKRATVLGQCPGVGVGGFMLGGGVSPLMSKFGLGCDNVVAAEVVLADGRTVTASAREHPDLYWAIEAVAATSA